MAKEELSKREIWQDAAGSKAANAEKDFYKAFKKEFKDTKYKLHIKPNHLKNIYSKVVLSEEIIKQIYNPSIDLTKTKWGVSPDFAIENTKSHKILFGEIKRQDGWVEGRKPSAGRGNAHERLCKLFTPGLQKEYRKIGRITSNEILPFWVVFIGDITKDPKRNREVAFWFDKYDKNYFMWRPEMSDDDLVNHFKKYLSKYLD